VEVEKGRWRADVAVVMVVVPPGPRRIPEGFDD